MTTAQVKLQDFLQKENIIISVNPPKIRTLTDGAILIEQSTVGVSYGQQEVSSNEPLSEEKGGTQNG